MVVENTLAMTKCFFSLLIDMLAGHLSKHPNIQFAIVFCETFQQKLENVHTG